MYYGVIIMQKSDYQYFSYDGIKYNWFGGLGVLFLSTEKGRFKEGDIRRIGGETFYINTLNKHFFTYNTYTIGWGIPGKTNIEDVRKVKSSIFSGN